MYLYAASYTTPSTLSRPAKYGLLRIAELSGVTSREAMLPERSMTMNVCTLAAVTCLHRCERPSAASTPPLHRVAGTCVVVEHNISHICA